MKNITVNCNEKKNGYEVRFNFDLEKVPFKCNNDESIKTLKDVVTKVFWNAETNRANWKPSRMYYYVKADTEMFNKVVWLLNMLKKNNYSIELKALKRSMSAPRNIAK